MGSSVSILSRDATHRYTFELDTGAAAKTAALAELTAKIAMLDNELSTLSVLLAEAEALEDAQLARIEAAVGAYIAAVQALPPGAPQPDTAAYTAELKAFAALKTENAPLRLKIVAVKFDRGNAVKRYDYWFTFQPLITRQAWTVTHYLTSSLIHDDLALSVPYESIEIDGTPALIVLSGDPFSAVSAPERSRVVARQTMSPEQAFFNAAILPGWQKFKPTYRWGTVTGVNFDDDTIDVELAPTSSTGQRLEINQADNLAAVPLFYPGNVYAFAVADRVVVQFLSQDWNSPRVIGFLDTPRNGRITFSYGYAVNAFSSVLSFESFGAGLGSGSVDRHAPATGGATCPDLSAVGRFKQGWGDSLSLTRTDTWTDDLRVISWVYSWVSFRSAVDGQWLWTYPSTTDGPYGNGRAENSAGLPGGDYVAVGRKTYSVAEESSPGNFTGRFTTIAVTWPIMDFTDGLATFDAANDDDAYLNPLPFTLPGVVTLPSGTTVSVTLNWVRTSTSISTLCVISQSGSLYG